MNKNPNTPFMDLLQLQGCVTISTILVTSICKSHTPVWSFKEDKHTLLGSFCSKFYKWKCTEGGVYHYITQRKELL